MRITNIIRISLVILVFIWVSLKGQERPEMIPYILQPMDYDPDRRLELGIAIIHPYTINSMPINVQKEETLEIIYERIAFEVIYPEHNNEIFSIDGKLYHLVRVPYTGASWDFDRDGWNE